MSPSRFGTLAAACFFVTGATSLVYQVVWSRYLTLTFGAAHYSVATVVAAYMLGLGLGGWLLGPRADRTRSPARLYALLELVIAAYGLASPLVLKGIERAFVAFHAAADPGPALATAVKAALALGALAFPTILMGGTLPVLSRALVSEDGRVAADVGRLYALNTLGAVAGSALAGFVLVEHVGLFRSLFAAALLNATAGVAILLARPAPAPAPPIATAMPVRELLASRRARVAIAAAFVAGFASLSDEIVWTRILALLTGSSTYAYTIILASFLLGIGLGAHYGARQTRLGPERALAWAQILAAAGAALLLVLFEPASVFVVSAAQNPLLGWGALLTARGLVAAVAVIPATIGFGATFPALVGLASRDARHAGSAVGLIYAANTAGAILGSLASGFLLIRWFSTYGVLRAAVLASLAIAAAALWLERDSRRVSGEAQGRPGRPLLAAALTLGLAIALLVTPPWPRHLLDLGAAIYLRNQVSSRAELATHMSRGRREIVFLKEGLAATVSVRDLGHARSLRINGKTDASSASDMVTQVMSGVLPLLVHTRAESALVIGAGSGVTARAVAEAPGIRSVDLAEIEPAVIEAGAWFEPENGRVYHDPRVRVLEEDGRNHLLTTTRRYDVIISEPSNPWMTGIANLFTVEHYRLVQARLASGGVFCQWVQRYGLTERTYQRILATVLEVFPEVQLWRGSGGDSLLLAAREPMVVDLERARALLAEMERRRPGEAESLLRVEEPEDFVAYYLLGRESLRGFVDGAPPYHDDPPELEFAALRDLYAPRDWQARIHTMLLRVKIERGDAAPLARPELAMAARLYVSGRAHLALTEPEGAVSELARAAGIRPSPRLLRWLAEARIDQGDRQGAEAALRQALALGPDARAAALLGGFALDAGRLEQARGLVAVAARSGDAESELFRAGLAAAEGDVGSALLALERAATSPGARHGALELFNRSEPIYRKLAGLPGGVEAVSLGLERRLAAQPRFLALRALRADLLAQAGSCREALADYDWLEREGVREIAGLAQQASCELATGAFDAARATVARARALEPWHPDLAPLERALEARTR